MHIYCRYICLDTFDFIVKNLQSIQVFLFANNNFKDDELISYLVGITRADFCVKRFVRHCLILLFPCLSIPSGVHYELSFKRKYKCSFFFFFEVWKKRVRGARSGKKCLNISLKRSKVHLTRCFLYFKPSVQKFDRDISSHV